jgi:hypothetical protein
MDLSLFQARLSALGADLSLWPPAEADAAVDLLAVSDAAVALLAEAGATDLSPDPADEQALADAVLARDKA